MEVCLWPSLQRKGYKGENFFLNLFLFYRSSFSVVEELENFRSGRVCVDQMFTLNKLYEKIDKEAENVRVGLKTWKRHMTRLN